METMPVLFNKCLRIMITGVIAKEDVMLPVRMLPVRMVKPTKPYCGWPVKSWAN